MKMTIGEIAKMAGVSKTTISRVLNNKPDVDGATRKRILDLIEEYDFQPNAFAKAISTQKSNHVGLLIPHNAEYVFSNPFYTEVMHGVSTEVDRQGYFLVMCFAHEANYLDIYKQKRVDGFVLLSPGSFHKNIINSLNAEKVPFISTAKISEDEPMAYVDVDNYYGATLAMEHLVALGHKRIAYIGKPSLRSSQDRLRGYQAVIEKYGLPQHEDWMLITDTSSVQGGHDYTLKLLQSQEVPTAIFLANDTMAIGALRAVKDAGLRIPEDIGVVGIDDMPFSATSDPPLTTIRQPIQRLGAVAAQTLIDMIDYPSATHHHIILPTELVIRASSGSPRQ